MNTFLIDFEFTGLDNTFITDNEIIQVKAMNIYANISTLKNFNSKKDLSAYTQIEHKTKRYSDCLFFSIDELKMLLQKIGGDLNSVFYGFGIEQDKKMLLKYGCELNISDIRAYYQKSEHAYRMATEGSGLETTYRIVTGKYPEKASHSSIDELYLIQELFNHMTITEQHQFMEVVPFGHCAGMPIVQYIEQYRRAADGYRFNNSDDFAQALDNAIYLQEDMDEDYI
jgi:hypothetical protein